MTCPNWAEWLDSRHLAVNCKKCHCIYDAPYTSNYGPGGKAIEIGGIPDECTVCVRQEEETRRQALPIDMTLVNAVKEYALAHYNDDGWDYIVESYTDVELWEVIAGSATSFDAIHHARRVANLLNERRSEVQSTEW